MFKISVDSSKGSVSLLSYVIRKKNEIENPTGYRLATKHLDRKIRISKRDNFLSSRGEYILAKLKGRGIDPSLETGSSRTRKDLTRYSKSRAVT